MNATAVMVGYTCASEGCHEQTQLPVIKAGWAELREVIYPLGQRRWQSDQEDRSHDRFSGIV